MILCIDWLFIVLVGWAAVELRKWLKRRKG